MIEQKREIKSKKAAANIIVVILLVLVAIAAVSLVGYWIYNFVLDSDYSFDGLSLSIDRANGICYNETSQKLFLSVKRGSDSLNLSGVMFSFTMPTGAVSDIIKDIRVPLAQETYAYTLPNVMPKPLSIQITPLLIHRNKEKVGSVVDSEDNIVIGSCINFKLNMSGIKETGDITPSKPGPNAPQLD